MWNKSFLSFRISKDLIKSGENTVGEAKREHMENNPTTVIETQGTF